MSGETKTAFPDTQQAWARLRRVLREAIAWKLFHAACRVSPEWHRQLLEDHFDAIVDAIADKERERHP
jgi:hypothetical protein